MTYFLKNMDKYQIAIQSMSYSQDDKCRIIHPKKIERFWHTIFKDNNIDTTNIKFSTFVFHNRAGNVNIDGWDYNDIIRKIDKDHPFDCSRIHNNLHILWNGDVILCCMDYHHETYLGNIKNKSINEIYESKECKTIYDQVRGITESPKDFICKRCQSPGG